MACGTLGVSRGAFEVSCGAVGVLCGASVGGLGFGLAGCGVSEMCGFPVLASVFAGDESRLFIVSNVALNELWNDY